MLDFVTFQNCKLQRYILRSYSCLYVSFSFFLYSNSDIHSHVVVNQIKPFLSKWDRVSITFTYIFFFASRPFIEWNVSSCRAFWIQLIVRFLFFFFFLLKLRFYNVHWRSLDHQSLSKFRTSTTSKSIGQPAVYPEIDIKGIKHYYQNLVHRFIFIMFFVCFFVCLAI